MKIQLTEHINNICKRNYFSLTTFTDEIEFYFEGDGMGDFEESSNSATEQIIKNYINECERQIILAKEYLENIK